MATVSSSHASLVRHETPTVGRAALLDATVPHEGVNFSIFSRRATAVELLLFDGEDDAKPARSITTNSATDRTYHYWYVFAPGVVAGQI
jgi:isoamylase